MKLRSFLTIVLAFSFWVIPAQASSRAIVRLSSGTGLLNSLCGLLGCHVGVSLEDPDGQLFVVTSDLLNVTILVQTLLHIPGVIDCEPDQLAHSSDSAQSIPGALTDTTPVSYYGTTVPHGYVSQPATDIVRLASAHSAFHSGGSGIVAVIDTGVDPNHPALSGVLLRGYDFTRNRPGADETNDVSFSTSPSGGQPTQVNSMTVGNVSQSTAAVVDGTSAYGDFGHGTMVAGVIHLVAPSARILPLKAFGPDGYGYLSNILHAIYMAVNQGSQVINMSFDVPSNSSALRNAVRYANWRRVICVAAAGNQGQETLVYPAALTDLVMGVASTTNDDVRSSFSNYGSPVVWVAAPGEGVVTTYPFGLYAAAWGTSFSTPFVAGTAALLVQMNWGTDQYNSSQAIAHAITLGSDLGNGRLDVYQAAQAWAQANGQW
jgi:subtilisin family serine protease